MFSDMKLHCKQPFATVEQRVGRPRKWRNKLPGIVSIGTSISLLLVVTLIKSNPPALWPQINEQPSPTAVFQGAFTNKCRGNALPFFFSMTSRVLLWIRTKRNSHCLKPVTSFVLPDHNRSRNSSYDVKNRYTNNSHFISK
jgi:hypothetical protein